MKKSYVKPEVTLVRFELSEAIASCDVRFYENHTEQTNCKLNPLFEEYRDINFTSTEGCSVPIEGYCYFTSTYTMLMNS